MRAQWHDMTIPAAHEDEDAREVEVVFTVSRYVAATYWQPAEGGEIEILAVRDTHTKMLLDPDDAAISDLERQIAEMPADEYDDRYYD